MLQSLLIDHPTNSSLDHGILVLSDLLLYPATLASRPGALHPLLQLPDLRSMSRLEPPIEGVRPLFAMWRCTLCEWEQ